MTHVTAQQAIHAIEAGMRHAADQGVFCSIAIMDSGRNLLAFLRQDGAILGSIEIAINKAHTSASLRKKTSAVTAASQPGGPVYGLDVAGDRPFVIFGGGVPILRDGALIGAVGVSGGSVVQDEAIADVVAAATLAPESDSPAGHTA